jgi:AAA15 family ATPase/GTPase
MISTFSVKNFRNFPEKVEIHCAAMDQYMKDQLESSSVKTSDKRVRLLKTIGIYGENGSGKSNFVRALHYLLNIVFSFRSNGGYDYNVCVPGEPIEFDIIFYTNGFFYNYEVHIGEKGIVYEQLGKGKKCDTFKTIFERKDGKLSVDKSIEKLMEKINGEKEPMSLHNNPEEEKLEKCFLSILRKYQNSVAIEALGYLSSVETISNNGWYYEIPLGVNGKGGLTIGQRKYQSVLEKITEALKFGRILVIDDFDSNLDLMSIKKLVESFNCESNTKTQLIFTGLNPFLLNFHDFRRDMFYFVQKEENGSTLRPLTDYEGWYRERNLEKYVEKAFT